MKIVIFNGPPRSGKNTAADYAHRQCVRDDLKNASYQSLRLNFADPLKEITHIIYGLKVDKDYFEHWKDTPLPEFSWKTPRRAYIEVSEERMKPTFGKDVFGQIFCRTLRNLKDKPDVVFVSDGGFKEEVEVIVDQFGENSLRLIHLTRPGCSFANDSRSYVCPERLYRTVPNDGELPDFFNRISEVLRDF